MPLVRIDLAEGQSAEYRSAVADEVYKAMTTTMNVPANDRFMVVNEHKLGDFIADPAYLGIERSPQCIIVQLTLNAGRDLAIKKPSTRRSTMAFTRASDCAAKTCSLVSSKCRKRTGRSVTAKHNTRNKRMVDARCRKGSVHRTHYGGRGCLAYRGNKPTRTAG